MLHALLAGLLLLQQLLLARVVPAAHCLAPLRQHVLAVRLDGGTRQDPAPNSRLDGDGKLLPLQQPLLSAAQPPNIADILPHETVTSWIRSREAKGKPKRQWLGVLCAPQKFAVCQDRRYSERGVRWARLRVEAARNIYH